MINDPEKRLIEALKNVDEHGDVAPHHVHDPMTMVLRENAIRTNLMRWDNDRDRYVLTGAGRRRIRVRSRVPGTVVSLRKCSVVDSDGLHGKPANLKEQPDERLLFTSTDGRNSSPGWS